MKKGPVWIPGERGGGCCRWASALPFWAGGAMVRRRGLGRTKGHPERLCRRALRLLHVCMAVEPLARIIRVILQSVPDMAKIMVLILFLMLVSALPCPQPPPVPEQAPGSLGIRGVWSGEEEALEMR